MFSHIGNLKWIWQIIVIIWYGLKYQWQSKILQNMDKLTLISGTLFMAADVFAIVSLAMPDWIITDVGGERTWFSWELGSIFCNFFFLAGDTRLGLMWTCMTLYNRPQVCFTPDLQPEWLLALVCIFVGCICITTTIILLASSHWDRNVIPYARWVGFTASMIFTFFKYDNNNRFYLLESFIIFSETYSSNILQSFYQEYVLGYKHFKNHENCSRYMIYIRKKPKVVKQAILKKNYY